MLKQVHFLYTYPLFGEDKFRFVGQHNTNASLDRHHDQNPPR